VVVSSLLRLSRLALPTTEVATAAAAATEVAASDNTTEQDKCLQHFMSSPITINLVKRFIHYLFSSRLQ
jgi:hypothetical protein